MQQQLNPYTYRHPWKAESVHSHHVAGDDSLVHHVGLLLVRIMVRHGHLSRQPGFI
jgi:hypothetical protein